MSTSYEWRPVSYKYAEPLTPEDWNNVVNDLYYLKSKTDNLQNEVNELKGGDCISKTYELDIDTTAKPLTTEDIEVKGIIISVTEDIGKVYLGNSDSQNLAIKTPFVITLNIKKPKEVYIRAETSGKAYIGFIT